ncbi:SusC/RagA family TonB-linked outer membrane protein [Maribellus maritimus]|uniref:SusC/RagA family TonB-linked outer membrane protein n=1 Tax=Maribellus maritimus TaxID=2870838 RepID=UPI001EEC4992|nr:TonB-dependent receptor [Maribellus maritimus]MCG6190620.1 TonB-dependent receptor [Maribellus maritimus]
MKKFIQILLLNFGLLGVFFAQAQTITVSGKVTDSYGVSLPGVNVVIKGTTTGTTTNIDGRYSLSGVSSNSTLIFSFIGFSTIEVPVEGQSTIGVSLKEDVIGIEEVVAIGYGTMKKSDLTGSVVSVKSEDLVERPSANLGQALQGKASGVLVRTTSSAPGGGVSITIRGHNSVNSGSQPLYIVDGVPLSNINTIPVEDIESIEVLKDASSTAIYGSRGANGVILVTTKKGSKGGKPQIMYSSRFTFETIPGDLNLMNGEEFATFYSEWELATDPGLDPADVWYNGSSYDRPLPSEVGEGTDWFDAITRTGMVQNHLISVNGGSDKSTYAMSVSYLNHKGLMISGQYDRINIKSAISSEITSWLDTGLDLFLSHNIEANSGENTSMEGRGGIINQAIKMSPALPIYTEDGDYQINNLPATQTLENPVAQAKEQENYQRMNRAFGNIYLNVKPVKDLSVKFSIGGDIRNRKNYYYDPTTTQYGRLSNGNASLNIQDNSYIINENIATYKKEFGIHRFDIVGGFTYEQEVYERLGASATDFFTDAYLYNNLAAATTYGTPQSNKTKWSLASGLGRINYVLADKYLFTVTGRYDGSSRFGEGNKWGFFPSVAGAWRVSEEEFAQGLDWLSYGKLRASWGETGNQNIGLYNSMATFGLANYPIGNQIVSGVAANRLANPDLKWETTQTLDIGMDIGLFNRLTFNVDYYFKKTLDLLLGVSLIETSGFNSTTMNTGELENEGWEFSLDAQVVDREVKWNTSASIFLNRNRITKLSDPTQDWKIGYPTGADRGYVVDGIIRDQADLDAYSDPEGVPISGAQIGDYRRVDTDGDYKITGEDQVIIFNPEPDFSFSMNNEITWKNFTLSMFLYGNYGGQIKNETKGYMTNLLNVRNNMSRELLSIDNGVITRNFWTAENTDSKYAKLGAQPQGYINIEDGSFLRIQNVMLSYNLPLENIFTQSSIYFSVQNLATFTKYTGWDPDVSSVNSNTDYGIDRASHPVPRSFTMGLNITF